MAIPVDSASRQLDSFVESTATANKTAQAVANPDGTNIGSTAAPILYGATATRTTVTPSLSSQTLIAANTARLGLKIVLTSVDPAQNIWIKCGASATSSNFITQRQGSGEITLFDSKDFPYTGLYSVISDAASGTIQVIELTT